MKFRLDLGWVVLLGPMFIVVSLTLFELPAWIAEEAGRGARYEASVHNDLGRSALKNGRYREAIGQFMTTIKIDPEYIEAYMNMGMAYNLIGDHKRAISLMRKVIQLDSTHRESVYNNIGRVYAEMGELDNAIAMFKKSLAVNRYSVAIYRNIGEIAIQEKNWKEAETAFRGAVANKPTLKNLYLKMKREAMIKFADDENYEQIKEILSHEITDSVLSVFDSRIVDELAWQDPKLADDFRKLGRALEMQGKLEEAVPQYEAALKILPDEVTIRNKLGVLYAKTGNYEKAMVQFREAVRLKPDYEDARKNMEMCQRILAGNAK